MSDFDPSPRSSKRRRTGTRRTTLSNADANLSNGVEDEAAPEDEGTSSASQVSAHAETPEAVEQPNSSSASHRAIRNSKQKSGEITRLSANRASDAPEQETCEATPTRRPSKKVGEDDNTRAKNSDQEKEAEAPGETPDTAVHTRSSRRTRRLPKRFAGDEETRDASAVSQRKSRSVPKAAIRIASPVRQESLQSPQPKGILTPSRRGKRTGPRKSVVFDGGDDNDKRIEEQLGFKDIDSSGKKKRSKRATTKEAVGNRAESSDIRDAEQVFHERATTPLDTENDDDDPLLFDATPNIEEILLQPKERGININPAAQSANVEDNEHALKIKIEILNRLTANSLSPIAHLEKEYTTLHTLLSATITAGESNSLLLLGSRGSGKTLLIEQALLDLTRKHADDFHIVRLNGFFQTDDKLALREIWRQLGREMAVSEDETGEVSSYADTMASLLSLLSHPEEFDPVGDAMDIDEAAALGGGGGVATAATTKSSKSVVFILDEFDLFTTHPRQTLLYNLFDIAQAKKAPIAVLGCSTRMDVVDLLEKRVKSRFSHRWLHVASMKSLVAFEDAVRGILCLSVDGHEALRLPPSELEWRGKWNGFIKVSRLNFPLLMIMTAL